MTDFITRYTSIPVLDLTGDQVGALMQAMFGGNEAPATADPPRPPTDPLKPTLPEMSPEKAAIIEKYRGKVLVP
jgi:hypothetical protein